MTNVNMMTRKPKPRPKPKHQSPMNEIRDIDKLNFPKGTRVIPNEYYPDAYRRSTSLEKRLEGGTVVGICTGMGNARRIKWDKFKSIEAVAIRFLQSEPTKDIDI